MTEREPTPVSVITSLAHRSNGAVHVVLHLPVVDLPPGPGVLRCAGRGRRVRAAATITAADTGVLVEATFAGDRLRRAVWRLAVKAQGTEEFVPVEARLLTSRRQPVALLPGPAPVTRLAEPAAPAPTPTPASRWERVRRRISARLRR